MGELVNVEHGGVLGLLHGAGGGMTIPKPFAHDIFLLSTVVAGTSHVEGIMELEPFLQEGDRLKLLREPDNSEDSYAILIKNQDGVKIGYIPQQNNVILARLMDAGKLLYAKIEYKKIRNDWLQLKVEVYLQE